MPMRRMVEGKSPAEIVALQAAGALDSALCSADFDKALAQTTPSTASHEHRLYEAWNQEFGTDDGSLTRKVAALTLTAADGAGSAEGSKGFEQPTADVAGVPVPQKPWHGWRQEVMAEAEREADTEHKLVVEEGPANLADLDD